MTNFEIDRLLGGTPCICGAVDTWHQECYQGKTHQQIVKSASAAYAKIRAALKAQRATLTKQAIEAVRSYGDSHEG